MVWKQIWRSSNVTNTVFSVKWTPRPHFDWLYSERNKGRPPMAAREVGCTSYAVIGCLLRLPPAAQILLCVCVCVRVNVKPRLNLPNCAKRTWTILSIWEHLILSYITLRKMFITFVSHARSMKLSSYIPASLRLTWTQSTVVVSSWKHV